MFVAGLVNDQVAVVHRLHTEVVEIKIGAGIKRVGEHVEIESLKQIGMNAFDGNAVGEVFLEMRAMGEFQALDTVTCDVPVEHFLVNVCEQDATGELREVGILLDQRAGIENDRLAQVAGGNFRTDRTTQLAFDFVFR